MERGVNEGREGLIELHLGAGNEDENLQNEGKYLQESVTTLLVIIVSVFRLYFKLCDLKSNLCFRYFTVVFASN